MRDFVGRECELASLRAGLDDALSGQGQLVLLVGEAGIGKTCAAQTFAETAAERGVAVLWGRCHPEPGAPPYWPWAQIFRRFAESLDDRALRAALGDAATYVAELCPELRERLPGLAQPVKLADPGQARFRLFDAVAALWRRAAAAQPLLLIFEDLHWADIPALLLLEFAAGEVASSRILFLGTIRDTELSGAHPLLGVLGELRRKLTVRHIALSGFTTEQTGRLLAAATGGEPPESAIAFVQAKTAGNPLFVAEMASYLAREGLLTASALSALLDPDLVPWHVPQGIRACIAARCSRLSDTTRAVLQHGAVIGTRFGFGSLRRLISDLSDGQILAALGEALAAHIIEDLTEPGRYEFRHVLTRDVLYDELPALERARLHERAGTALEEEHQHNLASHLSLLAHHFHCALPAGSGAKAIAYATRAGDQAQARLAYEEAANWFGRALSALDHMAPIDAALRCKLTIAMGRAQMKSGHALDALETLTEATSLASRVGAMDDLGSAAIEFEELAWRLGLPGMRAARLLEKSIDPLKEVDGALRARLQSALVRARVFAGMHEEAKSLHQATVLLARRVGDPECIEAALRCGFWFPWDPAGLEELLATADETVSLAQQIGSHERMLDAAAFRLHLLLAVGDFERFSRDLDTFAHLADGLHQPFHQYHETVMRAAQALFVGSFAEAEQLARRAAAFGKRLPGLDASGAFGMQMFALAQERGELPRLAPLVKQFVETTSTSGIWRPALALVLAEVGEPEQARAQLDSLAPRQFHAVPRDSLWLACLTYLAQACTVLRDRTHAGALYALLLPWKGRNLIAASTIVCYGPADRLLGTLSTVLHRWEAAARHFDAAIRLSTRQGSLPWLAHTQRDYAVMLAEREQPGDRKRARTLAASAVDLAERLGMTKLKDAASQLTVNLGKGPQRASLPAGLSPREAEVLRLIAKGKSNQEIASAIFRSPNTVANHVRSILTKLGAVNRTEAASFAGRHGLL